MGRIPRNQRRTVGGRDITVIPAVAPSSARDKLECNSSRRTRTFPSSRQLHRSTARDHSAHTPSRLTVISSLSRNLDCCTCIYSPCARNHQHRYKITMSPLPESIPGHYHSHPSFESLSTKLASSPWSPFASPCPSGMESTEALVHGPLALASSCPSDDAKTVESINAPIVRTAKTIIRACRMVIPNVLILIWFGPDAAHIIITRRKSGEDLRKRSGFR